MPDNRETIIALKATHTARRVANDIANPSTRELQDALHQEDEKRRQIEEAGRQSRERVASEPGPYVSEQARIDAQLESAWRSGIMGPATRFSPRERVFLSVFGWIAFAALIWALFAWVPALLRR